MLETNSWIRVYRAAIVGDYMDCNNRNYKGSDMLTWEEVTTTDIIGVAVCVAVLIVWGIFEYYIGER